MGHKSKRTYDKVFEDRKNMLEDLILHNDLYVPMKTKELAILMQVPKEDRHELQAVLDSLVAEGRIGVSKKGKYSKPENTAIIGIYQKTSRGFGFVVVEGREDDIFIKESDDGGAFHMDKVMVAITAEKHGDKRCEGKIIKILEHQIKEVVGTYQKSKTFGFVVPDNKKICYDIFVPQEKSMGAVTGHKVVVELTSYGTLKKNPEGRVKEIIGHINDPGTDIMSIIKAYDLPMEFPESVMKSLNDIPDELSPKDYAGRVDLRDLQTVTIDGEDAKDLDDAITVSEENGIYHLGVHIADVSNYVKEYSPLDKEAYKRGTSVYLVDRVIPMLPHKLSNGICSLNQGCDRLALSCLMDIDEKGNVISHKICESVINVDRRMTYTNVKKILENEDEEAWMGTYNLLTWKPVIYAANVSEDDLADDGESNAHVQAVRKYAAEQKSEVFVICAQIEEEISELDDDEKAMFLDDLGLKESGLEKLIKASYHILGLMSFLTAGEDETRAWTIKIGTKAPQAAGKIHSDFERGFIKAEVVNYQDLLDCGSYAGAREKGLVRMEGKDYVVQDGDVILFRFNV